MLPSVRDSSSLAAEQPSSPTPSSGLYSLLAVLVGLTPPLALLLTWLILLPFVAARAGLDLVGADDGLSIEIPPMGIMLAVFGLCSARAAQLHARANRTSAASPAARRTVSLLWLIGLSLAPA